MRGRGNRTGCACRADGAGQAARPFRCLVRRPGRRLVDAAERAAAVRAAPGDTGPPDDPRSRLRGAVPAAGAARGRPLAVEGAVHGACRARRPGRAGRGAARRGPDARAGCRPAWRSTPTSRRTRCAPGLASGRALSGTTCCPRRSRRTASCSPTSRTRNGRTGRRERLDALRQEARLVLARDRAKGAGRGAPDDVTAAWLAVLDHDPACEEAAAALIRGYLGAGRPEQAARVFERSRAALEELGLRVSPSLERVYAAADTRRLPPAVSAEPSAGPGRSASQGAAHAAHTAGPFGPGPVPSSPPPARDVGPAPPVARSARPRRARRAVRPGPPRVRPGPQRVRLGPCRRAPPATPPSDEPPRAPREERRPVTMLFAEVAAPRASPRGSASRPCGTTSAPRSRRSSRKSRRSAAPSAPCRAGVFRPCSARRRRTRTTRNERSAPPTARCPRRRRACPPWHCPRRAAGPMEPAGPTRPGRTPARRRNRRCGSAWSRVPPSSGRSAAAPRWNTPRSATWSAWRRRCSPRPDRARCSSARRPGQ